MRQPGVGQRAVRIARSRLLEQAERFGEAGRGAFLVLIPCPEAELYASTLPVYGLDQRRGLTGELRDERRRDGLRDLILDGEHVCQSPVVALGPEVETVRDADQLRGDAQAVVHPTHASLEHRLHAEFVPDPAQILRPALEREARGAPWDAQPRNPRQRDEQVFGDAVAQELVVRIRARFANGSTAIEAMCVSPCSNARIDVAGPGLLTRCEGAQVLGQLSRAPESFLRSSLQGNGGGPPVRPRRGWHVPNRS